MMGWWEKMSGEFAEQISQWRQYSPPGLPDLSMGELAAPLAITVQVIYLVVRPRPGAIWWRWGIGFVVLVMVLGEKVWVEQAAYCRVLLPLTVAFNMLLYQYEKGRSYVIWLVLGNIALPQKTALAIPLWIVLECWHRRSSRGRKDTSRQIDRRKTEAATQL